MEFNIFIAPITMIAVEMTKRAGLESKYLAFVAVVFGALFGALYGFIYKGYIFVNAFEGLVFNAYKRCLHWLTDKPLPDILRNLATYLEQDYSNNPYHVDWMKKVATEFNKTSAKQQNAILEALGESQGGNLAERKKLLKKAILKRQHGYEEVLRIIKNV